MFLLINILMLHSLAHHSIYIKTQYKFQPLIELDD